MLVLDVILYYVDVRLNRLGGCTRAAAYRKQNTPDSLPRIPSPHSKVVFDIASRLVISIVLTFAKVGWNLSWFSLMYLVYALLNLRI